MGNQKRTDEAALFELAVGVLAILFLLWCLYPAINCDGTAVRGLVRMECIEDLK